MANLYKWVLKCLCLFVLFMGLARAGFLERFCASKCNQGLGGNLCRCNGFHFAGKRTFEDLDSDQTFSYSKNSLIPINEERSSFRAGKNSAPTRDVDRSFQEGTEARISPSSERLEETEMFIQWLMDHVDSLKSEIHNRNRNTYEEKNSI